MAQETIEVFEGSSPALELVVTSRQPGGGRTAYDLTGKTVRFLIKPALDILDSSTSVVTYSSTGASPKVTVDSATGGTVTVQVSSADIPLSTSVTRPTTWWAKLNAVSTGGLTDTIMVRRLIIKDA